MNRGKTLEHSGSVTGSHIFLIAIMLSGAFIASPALPSIMRDMNIDAGMGQWLTTAFMLVNGIMIPITAYLINRFTTRQIFLFSMLIFTAGTAMAGAAPGFSVLLLGRIAQAVGAGIMMPMIQTVILLIFPREKRGAAMGAVGIVMAFAPAVGPTLAGWIIDTFSWQAMFRILVPIGIIDAVLAFFLLRNVGETSDPDFDVRSVIYSTLGFGGLLYGSSSVGSYGWTHPLTVVPTVLSVVFLILFFRRQVRIPEPLLEVRIFKNKVFAYSTVSGMIVNASLISSAILTPIYLQNILGYSALSSGLIMMPGAIIMGVMSPIAGNLFDRFGPRGLSLTGLSILTLGTVCYAFVDENGTFLYLCFVYTARMFGISILNMPLSTWGLNALDNSLIPHGSAINNTMRQIAGSIGTALLVTVMTMVSRATASQGYVASTLHGIHWAFMFSTLLSVVALILALIGVRKKNQAD